MKKHISILSIAVLLSAPVLAQQAPATGTAGSTGSTAQSTNSQQGVPGVEMNVGRNANDGGVPGVETNIGRDGDQNNVDTRALGAGSGTGTNSDGSMRPLRADRN